tara:strand:- start:8313 stop:8657 length:345 start_codon:yes stop_codon:yes gene_type:complete
MKNKVSKVPKLILAQIIGTLLQGYKDLVDNLSNNKEVEDFLNKQSLLQTTIKDARDILSLLSEEKDEIKAMEHEWDFHQETYSDIYETNNKELNNSLSIMLKKLGLSKSIKGES